MKLEIYHHNGQLAEYHLGDVTGLTVVGDNDNEPLTDQAANANRALKSLLYTTPGDPVIEQVPAAVPPDATLTVEYDAPAATFIFGNTITPAEVPETPAEPAPTEAEAPETVTEQETPGAPEAA